MRLQRSKGKLHYLTLQANVAPCTCKYAYEASSRHKPWQVETIPILDKSRKWLLRGVLLDALAGAHDGEQLLMSGGLGVPRQAGGSCSTARQAPAAGGPCGELRAADARATGPSAPVASNPRREPCAAEPPGASGSCAQSPHWALPGPAGYLNFVVANVYTKDQHVDWHSDESPLFAPQQPIISISLGETGLFAYQLKLAAKSGCLGPQHHCPLCTWGDSWSGQIGLEHVSVSQNLSLSGFSRPGRRDRGKCFGVWCGRGGFIRSPPRPFQGPPSPPGTRDKDKYCDPQYYFACSSLSMPLG